MTLKNILPASAILLMLTVPLSAGEKVDQSLEVNSDGVVQIENVRGFVRVEGWDEDEVSVKGELDDMAESLLFETNGSVTTIIVKMPRGRLNRGDGSNLIIRVPSESKVEFGGVSSDLVVENIAGGVDLNTVSGDIDAKGIQQQLYLKSVSGDITVLDSSGPSRLATTSGDIEAKMDSEIVETNVVSGDITLHLESFSELDATTVSGDVWVKGALLDGGETSASSVSGDVTFNFTQEINARINAKTGPGGDINNQLSDDAIEKVFPNQEKLNSTIGGGEGKVVITTVSGSINLKG